MMMPNWRTIKCCFIIIVSVIDGALTHHTSLNISRNFRSRVRSISTALTFGLGIHICNAIPSIGHWNVYDVGIYVIKWLILVSYSLFSNKKFVLSKNTLSRIQLMHTIAKTPKLLRTINASCSVEFFVQLKQIELQITLNKGQIFIKKSFKIPRCFDESNKIMFKYWRYRVNSDIILNVTDKYI